jgi:hypothetical protein
MVRQQCKQMSPYDKYSKVDDAVPRQKEVHPTFPNNKAKVAEIHLTREQLTKIFQKHDKNKDGKLSWDEVKAAFQELKASYVWLKTEQGFRHADKDED